MTTSAEVRSILVDTLSLDLVGPGTERRTALISAAVTGKIDVREFAYQETT